MPIQLLNCFTSNAPEYNVAPDWLIATTLGSHWPGLRTFALSHPEVRFTASHMHLGFFENAH